MRRSLAVLGTLKEFWLRLLRNLTLNSQAIKVIKGQAEAHPMQPNPRKRGRRAFEASNQMTSFDNTQMTQSKQTRRRMELDDQVKFLMEGKSHLLRKPPRKNAKELPPYPYIIKRVHHSLDQQRRVIWLRFGSLDSMERQWHPASQVQEMTGVSMSAQYRIIKRWLQRGMEIVSHKYLTGAKQKVPEHIRALIASPEWLLKQRHLSLAERAAYWREELNLPKLSAWSIRQYYLEHGTTFRKPQIVYCSKATREMELKHLQTQFSQEITNLLQHQPKTDIVYIDETSFHLWMSPGRVWLKDGMKVQLPDQRGQSITMIGALSVHHGLIHTEAFAGSNSVDTFLPFLQRLKAKCEGTKTFVVMDNLQVHHSRHLDHTFDDDFVAKYLPPQSCALNPIEQVWNLVKQEWKRTSYLILDIATKKEDQIRHAVERIQGIADQMDKELMIRMAKGNYEAMAKTLQGYLV